MDKADKVFWLYVAGIRYPNTDGSSRIEYVMKLNEEDELKLIRDPKNNFDQYAIKVVYGGGLQIGWVPKDYSKIIAGYLDSNIKYSIPFFSKTIVRDTYWVNCEFKLIIHI